MFNSPRYQEIDVVYAGARTVVYRAVRLQDHQSVMIKVLRDPHPSFSELVQFRNQYVITQHFDSPFVVKPLGLERYGNGYGLVMPDWGAIALGSYWQRADRTLGELLSVAIQLAEALHLLAGRQIIHKDIKPDNILIHPETQQVQLIDFSISSLLPKEQQQLVNPAGLEGTLAYIAPEQTGRMNRGLDYRTDFYGLGVTLYELLTGRLPFSSDDPLELLHCHIAQSPPPPAELLDAQGQTYPTTLSAIIMKLMAKNAENRYQSALGLKHDLERCLRSWEATGIVDEFELGEWDICDRFNIPEKLYGREAEVQTLLDAFDRVATGSLELMLVAGFSGVGKTVVVNEIHKPIVRQRGYFIKGKFDQFNRNIPFSAFVQAFRELMGQLLSESDDELTYWRSKLLAIVGEDGQVLIDVIPELEQIIGRQPPAIELSGTAAQNRFNLLFQKFLALFTTPEHPLVLFLDDLQWADSASLNLMKVLMLESEQGYLLLLGAYRDNEVFPAHPLMLTLSDLIKEEATVSTITLAPLPQLEINRLVAETLSCSPKVAQPLTDLIYQKTQGNPFFSTQFLRGLYEDSLITLNSRLGHWECDLVQIQNAALTDDVVVFMAGRLQKLPQETQNILKLAACIGNQFDLETLAIISATSHEDVAANLWSALREGLILPKSQAYKFFQGGERHREKADGIIISYRFLHDRVQQATYSLIQKNKRKATHLKIGKLLLKNLSAIERDEKLFDIVNHLNFGGSLALDDGEVKRQDLINLNLQALSKAKSSTAYNAAVEYAAIGLELLESDSWSKAYQLTLTLYIEAVESEYLNTNFERAEQLSKIVLEFAQNVIDCVPIYIFKMQFLIASNQLVGSLETALPILEKLGYPLVQNPEALQQIAPLPTLEELDTIPEMTDPYQLASLKILAIMTGPAYMGNSELLPYIVFRLLNLSLEYGHSTLAGYAYGMYSLLLCGPLNNIELGYHAGLLSSELREKFPDKEFRCKIKLLFNISRHWKEPARNCLDFIDAIQEGLDVGDVVYAGYCSLWIASYLFFMGEPLVDIENKQFYYAALMQKYKQYHSLYPILSWRQLTLNLQGRAENVLVLSGESFDEDRMQQLHRLDNRLALFFAYLAKLILLYTMQSYKMAAQNVDRVAEYEESGLASMLVSVSRFYTLLSLLAWYDEAPDEERIQILERVTIALHEMAVWAKSAPINYQHKYDLVKAEYCRVLGQKLEAITLYDSAIAGAKINDFLHEEALGNELFARFYLQWNREKEAALYIQEAYYCYGRWGAKAKTDQLEVDYPTLLAPIGQKESVAFDPLHTLDTLTRILTNSGQGFQRSDGGVFSDALNFSSILQAAQKLSSTIDLDQLLGEIAEIILTNAGAQKMALLMPTNQEWQLQVSAELTDGNLITDTITQPLTKESPVPFRLIQYVKNTQKSVLISEAKTELMGVLEGYLLAHQPQSVFCVPLLNQGEVMAIAYLEHPTTQDVFTPNSQTVVEFLCAQAAIALKNAQLYQQAQTALNDLQKTQLQLVQSEKMSALGNLMAGVAHEINNPVGFLQGNIEPAQDYVQDLFELIDLYQQKTTEEDEEISNKIESIELDFVREDLPNLMESMNAGVARIRNISTSLRTFSRTDRESQMAFDIHEGIDSTLLILQHRIKANKDRPRIEIIKEYGQLREVKCFPGQLNQVFMNILANAIDAFDEANKGKNYQEIEREPNQIKIHTGVSAGEVKIQIQDNGCGMKPSTVERIFEQGFTTKEVGKGTGLGMAIAHQIITEKHGGAISCTSEVGQGTTFEIAFPL